MSDDRVTWYRKILAEDPTSRIFVELAEVLFAQGEFRQVIELCRQGLELHPTSNRARVLLGLALWRENDLAGATRELTRVQKELEKNAPIYRALAEIHWSKGQLGRACKLMDTYLHLQPDDNDARATRHRWDDEIRNPPGLFETVTSEPEPAAVAQQPFAPTEPAGVVEITEPERSAAPPAEDSPTVPEPVVPMAVAADTAPPGAFGDTETASSEATSPDTQAISAAAPAPAAELDLVATLAQWRSDLSHPDPPRQPLGPILDQDLRSRLKSLLATTRVNP